MSQVGSKVFGPWCFFSDGKTKVLLTRAEEDSAAIFDGFVDHVLDQGRGPHEKVGPFSNKVGCRKSCFPAGQFCEEMRRDC